MRGIDFFSIGDCQGNHLETTIVANKFLSIQMIVIFTVTITETVIILKLLLKRFYCTSCSHCSYLVCKKLKQLILVLVYSQEPFPIRRNSSSRKHFSSLTRASLFPRRSLQGVRNIHVPHKINSDYRF